MLLTVVLCFTLHGFHMKKESAVLKLIIQFKPIHMYSLLGVGKPSITIWQEDSFKSSSNICQML